MKHDVLNFLSNPQAAQTAPSPSKPVQQATSTSVGGRPTLQVGSAPVQVGKAVKLEAPRSVGRGTAFADEPNNNIRRVIAKRLTIAKGTIPHEYITEEIKIDNLLKLRQNLNASGKVKLSVNDFIIKACGLALRSVPQVKQIIIKACGLALRNVPQVNANFDEKAQEGKLMSTVDISIAVATDKGLITPIIKNADSKNLTSISESMTDLATRARAGKLLPEEYQGGSFSISNLGMFGIEEFAAVINPPQAAILAVGAGKKSVLPDESGKPTVVNSVKVTLSFDGRVIDEVAASTFLEKVSQYLTNPSVLV
eukprot:CAMPEP_0168577644 /NCGR_PEP_ID=MMETSP0413-20121227/20897_1 /TAXON_ID=136452 /ORGANISM="Filamoeba nolandi, Strain NC-AS-23-1" /LENGTH=309 /DNA_ID=CAMNT_0008611413 /DNA_START=201 /DNA_END=1131 /DNA_ORIENTATION=+